MPNWRDVQDADFKPKVVNVGSSSENPKSMVLRIIPWKFFVGVIVGGFGLTLFLQSEIRDVLTEVDVTRQSMQVEIASLHIKIKEQREQFSIDLKKAEEELNKQKAHYEELERLKTEAAQKHAAAILEKDKSLTQREIRIESLETELSGLRNKEVGLLDTMSEYLSDLRRADTKANNSALQITKLEEKLKSYQKIVSKLENDIEVISAKLQSSVDQYSKIEAENRSLKVDINFSKDLILAFRKISNDCVREITNTKNNDWKNNLRLDCKIQFEQFIQAASKQSK